MQDDKQNIWQDEFSKKNAQTQGDGRKHHTVSSENAFVPDTNSFAYRMGKLIYGKDFSKEGNPLAYYGIRNILNNMVAIAGLVTVIVPARMGMGKAGKFLGEKMASQNAGALRTVTEKLHSFFTNGLMQNMLGVGLSFSTFRVMYKMGARGYDRIFLADSAEDSAKAIDNFGSDSLQDFKQIAPIEFPSTMVAATALVGLRTAVTAGVPEVKGNLFRDIMGCAFLAYPAFFTINESLYGAFQKHKGYMEKEDGNEHAKKSEDNPLSYFTREIPSIAAGIIPYIFCNNLVYRKTGRQASFTNVNIKEIDNFAKGFSKEILPYQCFWMYSLGRDLFRDGYDKIFSDKIYPKKSMNDENINFPQASNDDNYHKDNNPKTKISTLEFKEYDTQELPQVINY